MARGVPATGGAVQGGDDDAVVVGRGGALLALVLAVCPAAVPLSEADSPTATTAAPAPMSNSRRPIPGASRPSPDIGSPRSLHVPPAHSTSPRYGERTGAATMVLLIAAVIVAIRDRRRGSNDPGLPTGGASDESPGPHSSN
jgi:hypothetical protein